MDVRGDEKSTERRPSFLHNLVPGITIESVLSSFSGTHNLEPFTTV